MLARSHQGQVHHAQLTWMMLPRCRPLQSYAAPLTVSILNWAHCVICDKGQKWCLIGAGAIEIQWLSTFLTGWWRLVLERTRSIQLLQEFSTLSLKTSRQMLRAASESYFQAEEISCKPALWIWTCQVSPWHGVVHGLSSTCFAAFMCIIWRDPKCFVI